jgi:hypothetical protein
MWSSVCAGLKLTFSITWSAIAEKERYRGTGEVRKVEEVKAVRKVEAVKVGLGKGRVE